MTERDALMSTHFEQDEPAQLESGLGLRTPKANGLGVHNGSVAPNAQTELEPHSSNSELVRDAIIGLADGLTVPFALTAGLSSYVLGSLLLFSAPLHLWR